MSHIALLYAPADQAFAHQLAVQLTQRGLMIWPVPDPITPDSETDLPAEDDGVALASHLLGIISPDAVASATLMAHCEAALEDDRHVIALLYRPAPLPDYLQGCPTVDFKEPFLLAVEALVKQLKAMKAPRRKGHSMEHRPPVTIPDLLPIALPAERCWRDERLRINYTLPIILSREELDLRIPVFFAQARLEMVKSTKRRISGWRMREFKWFDPRRAEHTLTVQRRKDGLRVYYRMTRLQVYHWYRAHYYTFNREAAALYRYLVTGQMTPDLLEPVHRQARRARLFSWGSLIGFWVIIALMVWLLVW